MTHALVTRAVRALLEGWTPDPEYWLGDRPLSKAEKINNGECGCFAEALVERLTETRRLSAYVLDSGDYMRDLCRARTEGCDPDGAHLWTYVPETGLHYDAEAPEGVADWPQLPFFARWKRRHTIRRKHTRAFEAQVLDATAYLWVVTRLRIARHRRLAQDPVDLPIVNQGRRLWVSTHVGRPRERNATARNAEVRSRA